MPTTSRGARKQSGTGSLIFRNTRQLHITIVGGGRLGAALGRALHRLGQQIDLVITRHISTARRAAKTIDSRTLPATFGQLQNQDSAGFRRFSESDVIIIATPDAAIESVARQIAALFGERVFASIRKRQTVLHTSGAISSQILSPLSLIGFATGSFHPLVSVAHAKSDPTIFRGVYFCVEGNARAARMARMLVTQMGGRSFTIKSESKPLYHAAAVMTAGHIVALFDLAVLMLRKCGLSARDAQLILLPLLRSTETNLEKNNPARALTGPYARGDFETALKHLAALEKSGLKDANEVYKVLARHSLELGKTLKGDPNFEQLIHLLNRSLNNN